ncbi:hypothetical protein U728_3785 (plasmid) [Clostridium botulinum 202F]|nr:hypothetical protein U728_3785 [Clostridium botulinum 202F]
MLLRYNSVMSVIFCLSYIFRVNYTLKRVHRFNQYSFLNSKFNNNSKILVILKYTYK